MSLCTKGEVNKHKYGLYSRSPSLYLLFSFTISFHLSLSTLPPSPWLIKPVYSGVCVCVLDSPPPLRFHPICNRLSQLSESCALRPV